jgi:ABC-type sugar transport system substrate-binding protein
MRSLSLGGEYNPVLNWAVEKAVKAGIPVVVRLLQTRI